MKLSLRHSPWWVYLIIFIFSQLTSALVPFIYRLTGHSAQQRFSFLLAATLFLANMLAICLYFIFRPAEVNRLSTLRGVRGHGARRSGLVFLLALPMILLLNLIQEVLFPDIPDLVGADTMLEIMHHPLGLLTVAVLGPLSEELLFRGGMQTDMSRRYSSQGWQVPILFCALLFSLVHMNPAQMPVAFVLGFLLGFAYWWTGSLVAPVCIHIFNNSFACLLSFLSPDDDSLVHFLGGTIPAAAIALLSLFFLILILREVRKEGTSAP